MQEPFIFSRKPYVTEPEVWSWGVDIEQGRETAKEPLIEKFIRHRLEHRYIEPLKGAKSGFLIMAVSCLLIETLQSFSEGWDDSDGKSKTAFDDFFRLNADLFPNFKNYFPMVPHPKKPGKSIGAFYLHIRCGILHQAETTGGYSIVRDGTPLFSEKRINADEFMIAMKESVNKYLSKLYESPCNSREWTKAVKKIKHICNNCYDPSGHRQGTIPY